MKVHPTSIRLPADLKRDLRRLALKEPAEVERRSLHWLILRVLRQWADWKIKKAQEEGK